MLGFLGTVSISGSANAADPNFGSAAILTNRACSEAVGTDCAFTTPRTFTQYAGGLGTSFSTNAVNENGSGASGLASVSFDEGYLPTVKVASFSAQQTRTGASATAFRAYSYNGAAAINLVLTGSIHYITSGDTGVAGESAGEGIFNVNLAVLPISALSSFGTTAVDIINSSSIGYASCGAGEIAGIYTGSSGTTGDQRRTVSLAQSCSGGAITLRTGDTFIIYAGLQAISNRGGSLDASNTFSVNYDPVATVFADTGQSVGAAFFQTNLSAVPEPATWAMMLLGFGTAGTAMRRRRPPTRALAVR